MQLFKTICFSLCGGSLSSLKYLIRIYCNLVSNTEMPIADIKVEAQIKIKK